MQLLYRSTGAVGQPTVNVTSVLLPPLASGAANVVAYQSFYDSLNPDDEPSYTISGGTTLGGAIPDVESALFAPELLAGNAIVIADTEGETADFAAGPEYGINTLDSLRAALASPATGIPLTAKVAMIGYSGGAIATEWAAELAHTYARTLGKRLVGASFGGVLADPAHNLHYIDGSLVWAGVIPMAVIGLSRAFHIDLTPYLSEYGLKLYDEMQKASISEVARPLSGSHLGAARQARIRDTGEHPRLRRNGQQADHGNRWHADGPAADRAGRRRRTRGHQRLEARHRPRRRRDDRGRCAHACARVLRTPCHGPVRRYDLFAHIETATPWVATTIPWLTERFEGKPAPQNCSQIPAGNPLTPIP